MALRRISTIFGKVCSDPQTTEGSARLRARTHSQANQPYTPTATRELNFTAASRTTLAMNSTCSSVYFSFHGSTTTRSRP